MVKVSAPSITTTGNVNKGHGFINTITVIDSSSSNITAPGIIAATTAQNIVIPSMTTMGNFNNGDSSIYTTMADDSSATNITASNITIAGFYC